MIDHIKPPDNDERGQLSTSKGVSIIIGILVIGLIVAFLLPTAIDEFNNDDSFDLTVDSGNNTIIKSGLNVTVNSTDTTGSQDPDNATITIRDTTRDEKETNTVDNGTATTYSTFTGGDINVSVTNVTSSSATFTVDVPSEFLFDDGTQSMYNLIPLLLMLSVLLFVITFAMIAKSRGGA